MYSEFTPSEIQKLETENMTWNSHVYSTSLERFKTDQGLIDFWGHPTAISEMPDDTQRPFVASAESLKYPIFAT